jgi:hypothetical protein
MLSLDLLEVEGKEVSGQEFRKVSDELTPIRSPGCRAGAPLRSGQRTAGIIALASNAADASYAAADLKLLNTIALQTATALENSFLCVDMVEAARELGPAACFFRFHSARNILGSFLSQIGIDFLL